MPATSLEPLITECPSCRTRFRVSETQLGAAGGRVRCGACLSVFQGTDYLIFGSATSETSQTPAAELDELLDELDEATRPEPPATGKQPSLIERANAVARAATDKGASGARPRASAATGERESERVAEHVPAEPDALDIVTRELAGVRADVEEIELTAPAFGGEADDATKAPADVEAAPMPADIAAAPAAPAPTPLAKEEPSKRLPVMAAAPAADATKAEATAPEPAKVEARVAAAAKAEPSRPRLVEAAQLSLAPLPATVEEPQPEKRRRRRWWLPVALVLAIALVGQVLWLQFATWSVDPQIRPIYELGCRYLGCALPVMRDLTAIHARNLAVRTNPDVAGSLLVDALIVNEAQFAQPFPSIELRFSSMSGALVATRRFAASQYLSGELAGAKSMQPRTPVHIALDVEDPGNDAVNYVLVFL